MIHANGKLLLLGEYVILDGARALSMPVNVGQSLKVNIDSSESQFLWECADHSNKVWYQNFYDKESLQFFRKDVMAAKCTDVLMNIKNQDKDKFNKKIGNLQFKLEFPREWGLGSSSTFLACLGKYFEIDAIKLGRRVFGGSGYDIATANYQNAITYELISNKPNIEEVEFPEVFKQCAYFIYTGKKISTLSEIKKYHQNKKKLDVEKFSSLTDAFLSAHNIQTMEEVINDHEFYLSKILDQPTLKKKYFSDFKGTMKSLGAWGGDYFLACSSEGFDYIWDYFHSRGFKTILPFKELSLS